LGERRVTGTNPAVRLTCSSSGSRIENRFSLQNCLVKAPRRVSFLNTNPRSLVTLLSV
jgi:hypothetical protein